jgi:hypothetical protein
MIFYDYYRVLGRGSGWLVSQCRVCRSAPGRICSAVVAPKCSGTFESWIRNSGPRAAWKATRGSLELSPVLSPILDLSRLTQLFPGHEGACGKPCLPLYDSRSRLYTCTAPKIRQEALAGAYTLDCLFVGLSSFPSVPPLRRPQYLTCSPAPDVICFM